MMADRVHPLPMSSPPPHPDADTAAAATETTPLQQQHPSFHSPLAPPPGTYIIQIPKDQVLRVPPPDRARRYKKLAARPARRLRLRRACCASLGALLLLLLIAAAFAGGVYLVFRPRAPSFSVASLSIPGLNSSSSQNIIAADVRADNGANRRTGVDYRRGGAVTVSYSGQRLAAGAWPAFYQPPRNATVLALRGDGAVTLTDEQRTRLRADAAARAVPLTVEATVPVRLRFGSVLRTWTVDVRATCEVDVDRVDGTAAAVVNRGCRVRVKPLWWWW